MTVNRCACTRPSTQAAGSLGRRGDGCRAAVSSKEPPNLPSRLPNQQPFAEGATVKDTRFISTAPRLRPPKSLTEPEADARRPGSLTMGATAKVVLAIATLEGGLILKILYKAGRGRAPGSHLYRPAAAAPPSPPLCCLRLSLHHPTMQRARLRRSREATPALAGRKDLAPYVTDAARAM